MWEEKERVWDSKKRKEGYTPYRYDSLSTSVIHDRGAFYYNPPTITLNMTYYFNCYYSITLWFQTYIRFWYKCNYLFLFYRFESSSIHSIDIKFLKADPPTLHTFILKFKNKWNWIKNHHHQQQKQKII